MRNRHIALALQFVALASKNTRQEQRCDVSLLCEQFEPPKGKRNNSFDIGTKKREISYGRLLNLGRSARRTSTWAKARSCGQGTKNGTRNEYCQRNAERV